LPDAGLPSPWKNWMVGEQLERVLVVARAAHGPGVIEELRRLVGLRLECRGTAAARFAFTPAKDHETRSGEKWWSRCPGA
jgi:hypothetical protein